MTKEQREELKKKITMVEICGTKVFYISFIPVHSVDMLLDFIESEVEKAKKEELKYLQKKYGDEWFIDMNNDDIEEEKKRLG